jgi:hypothetical protein
MPGGRPDIEVVDPSRVRSFLRQFAWVDPRLRDVLSNLTLEEIALLFFLHLAADRHGCSFWSDATLAKRLPLREEEVRKARAGLVQKDLVAYRYPLYQILALEGP